MREALQRQASTTWFRKRHPYRLFALPARVHTSEARRPQKEPATTHYRKTHKLRHRGPSSPPPALLPVFCSLSTTHTSLVTSSSHVHSSILFSSEAHGC